MENSAAPTDALSGTSALDRIRSARRAESEAQAAHSLIVTEHADAKRNLETLVRTPQHQQADPEFLLKRERAEARAVEVAKRLEESKAQLAVIREAAESTIAAEYAAWQAEHDRVMHGYSTKLDKLLADARKVITEMQFEIREDLSVRAAAGVRGPDSERQERNIAAVVINSLPLAPLRRAGSWTAARQIARATDIWPAEPTRVTRPVVEEPGVEPVEVEVEEVAS